MLYVVSTPIGNLEDMTFRSVQVLQNVDLIASEDTRNTSKLLRHFQIHTPQISYHEHNRNSRIPQLIEKLHAGQAIALVSDAGTPGISDPGHDLVTACIYEGISITPIPGASALITALSAAGLPTNKFVFEGFLPAKTTQRRQQLELLEVETRTMVFYESPHRLKSTLKDLENILGGERHIVMARELTKIYEEFWRGTITDAIIYYTDIKNKPQGEYTLLISGKLHSQTQFSLKQLKAELAYMISQGIPRSQASRELAQTTSLPRRQLYKLALSIDPAE
ncbi:rRNA small subunit methyltransferase I [Richelia intracellularis HH01]|uniref:Ribosomal RNA small subunit methyltransferase I n=1 Tax=Richelia intracellularis HH01 TaxID=1165094 RepID=M1X372_9NOST|nr:16S rRNA (cytidine(1402)-2'-O)-methyltransferase [Richelia intracellularis]CCH68070.1 rRNA small subunit methyltransferase I [Richelia intracellularis HH01]HAE05626.1 16S rRNA (cytidine(1402)-2'-O)-methyltransferase [Richelia sp.]